MKRWRIILSDYTIGDALKDVEEINELLETSNNNTLNISDWEREFMESIRGWKMLSDKQIKIVKKIADNI